jgi:hypothetical protein
VSIPIVFIHQGNPNYLQYSLSQAHKSNPGSEIVLIGDPSNDRYDYVHHIEIENYSNSAMNFTEVYKHHSPNPYEYELFCIQRWFVLYEYMKKHELNHSFYLDSDVLLFTNITKQQENQFHSKLAMFYNNGPCAVGHSFYANDRAALKKMCQFFVRCYTNQKLYDHLAKLYIDNLEKNAGWGISDMVLLKMFKEHAHFSIQNLSLIYNESLFDSNINHSEGMETQGRRKKIFLMDGIPYGKLKNKGKWVRLRSLHLQGESKQFMRHFMNLDTQPKDSILGFNYDSCKWV